MRLILRDTEEYSTSISGVWESGWMLSLMITSPPGQWLHDTAVVYLYHLLLAADPPIAYHCVA